MPDQPQFSIRRATPADAPAILDCLSAAFASYRDRYTPAGFADTVLNAETFRRRMTVMSLFVAVSHGGGLAGTIGCQVSSTGEGHLRGMAVLPQWQGCDIAAQLLAAAESELASRGCARVTLDTTEPLERAMRFYEKNGYRRSGRITDFFGMPLIEYVKVLQSMKTLGIVGGLGPESTIEYYRFILAAYRERRPGTSPAVLINSLDVDYGIALLDGNRLTELEDYLVAAVERLARAGADFALMAANTPHLVFDPVQRRSPIPMLSIVEATREEAQHLGLSRLALLGTGFTMRGRFYPEVFTRAGIELVVPSQEEQAFIHHKYVNELLKNQFLPATRDRLLAILDAMKRRDRIEGVILAGTELPLILREVEDRVGIPLLDTTKIHVERAVRELLS